MDSLVKGMQDTEKKCHIKRDTSSHTMPFDKFIPIHDSTGNFFEHLRKNLPADNAYIPDDLIGRATNYFKVKGEADKALLQLVTSLEKNVPKQPKQAKPNDGNDASPE